MIVQKKNNTKHNKKVLQKEIKYYIMLAEKFIGNLKPKYYFTKGKEK